MYMRELDVWSQFGRPVLYHDEERVFPIKLVCVGGGAEDSRAVVRRVWD